MMNAQSAVAYDGVILTPQPEYTLHTYHSEDITADIVAETADIYRYIFNNSSDHFFIHRDGEKVLSRADIIELKQYGRQYIPNEVIDDLYVRKYRSLGYQYWHDPVITAENIGDKFKRDAQLVLLRERASGAAEGFIFGRKGSVGEIFASEEWVHPYVYSLLRDDKRFEQDTHQLLEALNDCLQKHDVFAPYLDKLPSRRVELETPIYCWNAHGATPKLWGTTYTHAIFPAFRQAIPVEFRESLLEIGEGSSKLEDKRKRSNLDVFMQKGGAKKVAHLGNHSWVIVAPLNVFVDGLASPKQQTAGVNRTSVSKVYAS